MTRLAAALALQLPTGCDSGPPPPSADMPGFGSALPAAPPPAPRPSAAVSASAAPLACPSGRAVLEHQGQIHLCEGGAPRSLGSGRAPSLSPAGTAIAFARDAGVTHVTLFAPAQGFSKPKPSGDGWVEILDTSVHVLDAASGKELARAGNDGPCLSLSAPTWVDERTLLVEVSGYGVPNVHNRSTCLFDVAQSKLWLLASRTACVEPIRKGPRAGHFYVSGFDLSKHGLSDFFGVVDRNGKVLHRYADDPFALDWDGDGRVGDRELAMPCDDALATKYAARIQSTLEKLR